MSVTKVDLKVSQLLEDLDNGLTWYAKDDFGNGSIEAKYNAKAQQITLIRKHPALVNAETNFIIFNIIDDTKAETAATLTEEFINNQPIVKQAPAPAAEPEPVVVMDADVDAFANL